MNPDRPASSPAAAIAPRRRPWRSSAAGAELAAACREFQQQLFPARHAATQGRIMEILRSLFSRLRGCRSRPAPRNPELDVVGRVWESQARSDPLWAVLSERDKRGRGWKFDEFLATGEQ